MCFRSKDISDPTQAPPPNPATVPNAPRSKKGSPNWDAWPKGKTVTYVGTNGKTYVYVLSRGAFSCFISALSRALNLCCMQLVISDLCWRVAELIAESIRSIRNPRTGAQVGAGDEVNFAKCTLLHWVWLDIMAQKLA